MKDSVATPLTSPPLTLLRKLSDKVMTIAHKATYSFDIMDDSAALNMIREIVDDAKDIVSRYQHVRQPGVKSPELTDSQKVVKLFEKYCQRIDQEKQALQSRYD